MNPTKQPIKKEDDNGTIKKCFFDHLKMNKKANIEETENKAKWKINRNPNFIKIFSMSKSKKEEKGEANKEKPKTLKNSNKIDNFKSKISTSFRGKDEKTKETQKQEGSKTRNRIFDIKNRFSNIAKFKNSPKEDGGKISKKETGDIADKNDKLKNRFSNLLKNKSDSVDKSEVPTKTENLAQPERLIKKIKERNDKEGSMSQFQWTMVDGQWRKSQSVGL